MVFVGSYAHDSLTTQDAERNTFMERWGKIDARNFDQKMSEDDIKVTNNSDKPDQLKSLRELPNLLQPLYEASGSGETAPRPPRV